ncbi:hypothetical protein E2C01_097254 [Portunus trituberculatus]|uniref:Uncharacterized protein n=1 Tax=Portunus trituberculatus TaxID=210409 RepID=A0A5B7KAR9_PORTR|nr:hypothetical protein [Portunus trituberculatus]
MSSWAPKPQARHSPTGTR